VTIYLSSTNYFGDFGAVLEEDSDVLYFYLLSLADGMAILDFVYITNSRRNLASDDFSIKWSWGDASVGLFVKGVLNAAFEVRLDARRKWSGGFDGDTPLGLGKDISEQFGEDE
jgi:hypothetical protein